MAIVDSSQTRVAVIKETTWGTTPSSPVFLNARYTGESLNLTRTNIVSDEIRSDRNVTDLVQVAGASGGGLTLEMSYGGSGSALDAILESALFNTFSTNVLTNGVSQQPMTIEKTFEAGTTDVYLRHVGMVANTFSLTATAGRMVTASADFMGGGGTTGTAILTSATYTAAPSGGVMNAATGFASLSMTGLTSPKVMTVTVNVNNNLRQQAQLGSITAAGIGSGRFEVTGTAEIYLEDKTIIDLLLAGTASSLSFTIGTTTLQKYTVSIPSLKFDSVDVTAGGNNQDVMARANWRGIYDSGIAGTLRITRAVA
jgi:Phage tail tube protein